MLTGEGGLKLNSLRDRNGAALIKTNVPAGEGSRARRGRVEF